MKLNFKKGFTLIELLVVVAIIGILASVVLASLNSARNKGKDAAVIAGLSSLRSAAEVDYSTNTNYNSVCTEAGDAAGNSTLSASGEYQKVQTAITAQGGGTAVCNEAGATNSTAYMVYTYLPSNTSGLFYCIDSTGVAKSLTAAPTANTTVCP